MSMQQIQQHFPLGAHLIVKHFGYSHHGIYAGRGRVIHYSGFAHIFKKRPIEMTLIQRFARPYEICPVQSLVLYIKMMLRRQAKKSMPEYLLPEEKQAKD